MLISLVERTEAREEGGLPEDHHSQLVAEAGTEPGRLSRAESVSLRRSSCPASVVCSDLGWAAWKLRCSQYFVLTAAFKGLFSVSFTDLEKVGLRGNSVRLQTRRKLRKEI